MNAKSDLRVCKNKNCQKILPEGYKHKYCEACRNQHAHVVKMHSNESEHLRPLQQVLL